MKPARAVRLEPLDDPAAALGRRQPVELARVDEHLVLRVLDVRRALVDLAVWRPDDLPHGRSNACAKSKSRWSCAGTAMIAPVP